jgi:hypothetical protein
MSNESNILDKLNESNILDKSNKSNESNESNELKFKKFKRALKDFGRMNMHYKAGRLLIAVDIASAYDEYEYMKTIDGDDYRLLMSDNRGELLGLFKMAHWDWAYINKTNKYNEHQLQTIRDIKDIIFGYDTCYFNSKMDEIGPNDTDRINSLNAARDEYRAMKLEERKSCIEQLKTESWEKANTYYMRKIKSLFPVKDEYIPDDFGVDIERLWEMKLDAFYGSTKDILEDLANLREYFNIYS